MTNETQLRHQFILDRVVKKADLAAALPTLAGGALGAGLGYFAGPTDEDDEEGSGKRNAIVGGLLGAGAGHVLGNSLTGLAKNNVTQPVQDALTGKPPAAPVIPK